MKTRSNGTAPLGGRGMKTPVWLGQNRKNLKDSPRKKGALEKEMSWYYGNARGKKPSTPDTKEQ